MAEMARGKGSRERCEGETKGEVDAGHSLCGNHEGLEVNVPEHVSVQPQEQRCEASLLLRGSVKVRRRRLVHRVARVAEGTGQRRGCTRAERRGANRLVPRGAPRAVAVVLGAWASHRGGREVNEGIPGGAFGKVLLTSATA